MAAIDRLSGILTEVAIKAPCRVATTANITLNGLQTIDGVSVVSSDRVLVWNQSDNTQNGIYACDTGNWARTPDFDGTGDCVKGTMVAVVAGSTYAESIFQMTSDPPETFGEEAVTFAIMGAAALGAVSSYMQTVLPAVTAAAARTTLGAVGLTGDDTITGTKTYTGTTDATGGRAKVPTRTRGDNGTDAASTGFVATALGTLPTFQDLTSGSAATYTTPANAKWLRIRMVGAGGGGGGGGLSTGPDGSAGGDTTFNSIVAKGGSGGGGSTSSSTGTANNGGAGGTGGTGSVSGVGFRVVGQKGATASANVGGSLVGAGSGGGSAFFGGGGSAFGSVSASSATGNAGSTNTGGGGSAALSASVNAVGAGGGGESVEFIITSPSATYTYTVGGGGAGGIGTGTGAATGGAGAAGRIIVEEHYV